MKIKGKGKGEENWGETESGKEKARRIGTRHKITQGSGGEAERKVEGEELGRDRKWEGEGEENWGETGSGKEKARRIGTRHDVGRRRRGELGRDMMWEGEGEENWD